MDRPIRTERITVAGIPALHIRRADLTGPAPTILFYHGWSSAKEKDSNVITAEAVACEGYRVIVPDAVRHGERDALPVYDNHMVARHFWEVIMHTVDEAETLHGALLDAGWALPDRIGVAGYSMGGYITAGVFARYPWIKAAVLLAGGPCYQWADGFYRKAAGGIAPVPALTERLKAYDPEEQLGKLPPRPLLMLHGDADPAVPVGGVRRYAELARPYYREQPQWLQLTEFTGLTHFVTAPEVGAARAWFREHL